MLDVHALAGQPVVVQELLERVFLGPELSDLLLHPLVVRDDLRVVLRDRETAQFPSAAQLILMHSLIRVCNVGQSRKEKAFDLKYIHI